jgi:aminopeptidase N
VDALRSLTRDEAATRADAIEVLRYDIEVDFTGMADGPDFAAVSTVRFRALGGATDTFVDCATEVRSARLNGADIDVADIADSRIELHDLAAENVLVVESVQSRTNESTGVHRSVDPADKQVYVWTSFEPDEARRAWACFDQPDLKAPHAFSVLAPDTWTVLSNTGQAEVTQEGAGRRWRFAETPPLSTYVVVVNAGPFYERRTERDGYQLGLYSRQSLAAMLDRDADELFDLTAAGLAWFGDRFAMPFPQTRYDQVFVPDLGGAMENYGCVTWSDALLYRSDPTHNQRETRASVLLHEMAHMWFGDIVTMRWWDDLWLNEAFAEWAANWATAAATEFVDKWAAFLTLSKVAGYRSDRAPSTHPIRRPVADVATAAAGFDNITYCKGASALKQLVAYVGEDEFLAGLRTYFTRHAWGNASLDDLVAELEQVSGRDLGTWVKGWLETAGTDELSLRPGPDGFDLVVEPPPGTPPRPHRLDVGVYDGEPTGDSQLRLREALAVWLDGPEGHVPTTGAPATLLLVNDNDLTFAGVRPDRANLAALVAGAGRLPRAISRAVAGQTVWDALALGDVSAAEFVRCADGILRRETADAVVEPFLALAVQAAQMWSSDAVRADLLTTVADTALAVAATDPSWRQGAVRALARTATTDEQIQALHRMAGDDVDLSWRAMTREAALGRLDEDRLEALLARDPDPDAATRAVLVRAALPDPGAKAEAWGAAVVDRKVPMGMLVEFGAAFWQPEQASLLAPFVDRFVEAIPDFSTIGMIPAMTISAVMFPVIGIDEPGLARILAAGQDDGASPLVSRTIAERADQVRRMLAARAS